MMGQILKQELNFEWTQRICIGKPEWNKSLTDQIRMMPHVRRDVMLFNVILQEDIVSIQLQSPVYLIQRSNVGLINIKDNL
jgi:hypothetical protein